MQRQQVFRRDKTMNLVHSVLFGIGMLILIYLGVKNSDGVAKVFTAGGTQGTNAIKALQGR